MVPMRFERVNALPRLPSGKVDRKALRNNRFRHIGSQASNSVGLAIFNFARRNEHSQSARVLASRPCQKDYFWEPSGPLKD